MRTVEMFYQLSDQDQLIINYIKSMLSEYADELLLNDGRWEIYWALSSVRRYSLDFYPFSADSEILIMGDKFGALTGILCEKAKTVKSVVPTHVHEESVKKRYFTRDNLNVFVDSEYRYKQLGKYQIVCVNLEYTLDYDLTDDIMFNRLIDPAIEHLTEDGKLLISVPGYKYNETIKLLYRKGLIFHQSYDPLYNGAFVIEASRKPVVPCSGEECLALIQDKWTRKYNFPFWGNNIQDQDSGIINKVMRVQIDLLRKLVEVCKRHDLIVYPMYGTLLGLMRDGGIISGDDDIDVALSREDYDKLLELADEFTDIYFLQSPYNDECFFGGYMKLRNRETTAIHPQNWWADCCEGISIDIFPIDISYRDIKKENRKRRKIRFLQRLLYAKPYGEFYDFKDMPLLLWKSYKYFGKLFTREQLVNKLYQEMRKGDSGTKLAIYCHYGRNAQDSPRYMTVDSFTESFRLLFEGIELSVPVGWDTLLQELYGGDYNNGRDFYEWKRRHGFYDTDIPYPVYKKRFGGLKNPSSITEKIVLFGDGSIFKACLTYYKDKVDIAHLVLLPEEKPMKPVMGILVEDWETFHSLKLDKSSYRAVICSGDVRLAEKIMSEAGYENYYIFWHNREWMVYANQSQIWKEIRELP